VLLGAQPWDVGYAGGGVGGAGGAGGGGGPGVPVHIVNRDSSDVSEHWWTLHCVKRWWCDVVRCRERK
jgi:hypothetical protein